MAKQFLYLVSFITILSLVLGGFYYWQKEQKKNEFNKDNSLKIVTLEAGIMTRMVKVPIQVKNISSRKIIEAELLCNIYDQNGLQIGFEKTVLFRGMENGFKPKDVIAHSFLIPTRKARHVSQNSVKVLSIQFED